MTSLIFSNNKFIPKDSQEFHEKHMKIILDAYGDSIDDHPSKLLLDKVIAKRNPSGITKEQLKLEQEAFVALHEILLSESRNRITYEAITCRMS